MLTTVDWLRLRGVLCGDAIQDEGVWGSISNTCLWRGSGMYALGTVICGFKSSPRSLNYLN